MYIILWYNIIYKETGDIMYKEVTDTKISFYDDSNNEIMYIDYSIDECIWYFKNNRIIIKDTDELFEPLKAIFLNQYEFNDNEILKSYKNSNELVWYSDCYYNPDDEWSRNSVSYLKILLSNNEFQLQCIKPLDNIVDRKDKSHIICFSPLGNGKYARNIETGLTLQDDFVINVYQKLLRKDKVKDLRK